MMQWRRFIPYLAGFAVCLALLGVLRTPSVVAAATAVRAALVEVAIPAQTYQGSMIGINYPEAVGPGTGTLGVTNLTLTNYDTTKQLVYLFQPYMDSPGCGGTVIGGVGVGISVYVQPGQTLVIPYPTPWKFSPVSGSTCIGSEVTTALHGGSVEVDITGVIN